MIRLVFRFIHLLLILGVGVLTEVKAGMATFTFDDDPRTGVFQSVSSTQSDVLWSEDGEWAGTGNPGGFLSLTEATSSTSTVVVIPDLDEQRLVDRFHFEMDVRMGNGTTGRPADGFSVSYARAGDPLLDGEFDVPGEFERGQPENGAWTGLVVSFDTWQGNTLADGSRDIEGIIVLVDGKAVSKTPMPTRHGACQDATSMQTGPRSGQNSIVPHGNPTFLCWSALEIDLAPGGLLSLSWKGQTILDQVETDFTPTLGQFVIAGRTGGANQVIHLDNIEISTGRQSDAGAGGEGNVLNSLPTVSLVADPSPSPSAPHGSLVEFHATAKDADGQIDRVEYYEDGSFLGVQEFGPHDRYTFGIDTLELGLHSIVAWAIDDRGGVAVSSAVSVEIVQAGNLPPDVFLEVTPSSITVGEPVRLEATAKDFNGPVTLVEFFSGEMLLGEVLEGDGDQFHLVLDSLGVGDHSIRARAMDLEGDRRFSAPAQVTVLPQSIQDSGQTPNEDSPALREIVVSEQSALVSIVVSPPSDTIVYVLEEQLPVGTTAAAISGGGVFNPSTGVITWGPYFGHDERTLSYAIDLPGGGSDTVHLRGTITIDGSITEVGGAESLAEEDDPLVHEGERVIDGGRVILNLGPDTNTFTYAVEERLPEGVIPLNPNEGGAFDSDSGILRWGPFFDNQARTLQYQLDAASLPTGLLKFDGVASFDGVDQSIGGHTEWRAEEAGAGSATSARRSIEGQVVSIEVIPHSKTFVYAIEEEVPPGVQVSDMNLGAAFDAEKRKIKWGPFFDNETRVLTYQVSLLAEAPPTILLSGTVSLDGIDVAIRGESTINRPEEPVVTKGIITRSVDGVEVTLNVVPKPEVFVYAVEETIPIGLDVLDIGESGFFDSESRKIKWGPFFDNNERALSYSVSSATGETGTFSLNGAGSFDGVDHPILGGSQVEIAEEPEGPIDFSDELIRLSVELTSLPVPGGQFQQTLRLSWNSVPGGHYVVESSSGLGTAWESILENPIEAVNQTTGLTQAVRVQGSALYRVLRVR